jgi:hypothetical protein
MPLFSNDFIRSIVTGQTTLTNAAPAIAATNPAYSLLQKSQTPLPPSWTNAPHGQLLVAQVDEIQGHDIVLNTEDQQKVYIRTPLLLKSGDILQFAVSHHQQGQNYRLISINNQSITRERLIEEFLPKDILTTTTLSSAHSAEKPHTIPLISVAFDDIISLKIPNQNNKLNNSSFLGNSTYSTAHIVNDPIDIWHSDTNKHPLRPLTIISVNPDSMNRLVTDIKNFLSPAQAAYFTMSTAPNIKPEAMIQYINQKEISLISQQFTENPPILWSHLYEESSSPVSLDHHNRNIDKPWQWVASSANNMGIISPLADWKVEHSAKYHLLFKIELLNFDAKQQSHMAKSPFGLLMIPAERALPNNAPLLLSVHHLGISDEMSKFITQEKDNFSLNSSDITLNSIQLLEKRQSYPLIAISNNSESSEHQELDHWFKQFFPIIGDHQQSLLVTLQRYIHLMDKNQQGRSSLKTPHPSLEMIIKSSESLAASSLFEILEKELIITQEQWHSSAQSSIPWQPLLIPLYDQNQLHHIMFFIKQSVNQEQKQENDPNNQEESSLNKKNDVTRFIVEIPHSAWGTLQIDGLFHRTDHASMHTNLQLYLRSDLPFSTEIEGEIYQLYKDLGEITGFDGQIIFQPISQKTVNPLDDIKQWYQDQKEHITRA